MSDAEILKLSEQELNEKAKELESASYEGTGNGRRLRPDYNSADVILLSRINQRISKIESDQRKQKLSDEINAELHRRNEHAKHLRSIALTSGAKKWW